MGAVARDMGRQCGYYYTAKWAAKPLAFASVPKRKVGSGAHAKTTPKTCKLLKLLQCTL